MALDKLLGDISPGDFLDQYFLKTPFALSGACAFAVGLGSRAVVEAILAGGEVDAILSGPTEAQRVNGPMSPAELAEAIEARMSVGIRHAQRHDAALAGLAADFANDFLAPADVHLYLKPAESPGFGWHYDAEDVFILQTSGTKHWELRKNTVNPWPLVESLPDDMQFEREIMPVMRCTLNAGDWL